MTVSRLSDSGAPGPLELRERLLQLPSRDDGYRQVLVLGTTGAGKTTVMRQLLGTDERSEKFPATSPNKTTVAPTEVVGSPSGTYQAIVTFHPIEDVVAAIEENVDAAITQAALERPDAAIAEALLVHRDLAFRFQYTLGSYKDPAVKRKHPLKNADLARQATIQKWIDGLRLLVRQNSATLVAWQPEDSDEEPSFALAEKDALTESLRRAYLGEILDRIAAVDEGQWEFHDNWPLSWSFESDDRADFLRRLRTFTGNEVKRFGSLLTPLVNGVRVKGAFQPTWAEAESRLVLLDTEGLGHTSKTATSIPNHVVQWMRDADAILLVDNAQQPVLASPTKVLETVAQTGNTTKLFYLFTHMDEIKGDNLDDDFYARSDHIRQSLNHVLGTLHSKLGSLTADALQARCEDYTYFVGHLNQSLTEESEAHEDSLDELRSLLNGLNSTPPRPEPRPFTPHYSLLELSQVAAEVLNVVHAQWAELIGNQYAGGTCHWASVKALTRRLGPLQDPGGVWLEEGWRDLYPAAALREALEGHLRQFIENPDSWDGGPLPEEKLAILDAVSQGLTRSLIATSDERVLTLQIDHWTRAFDHSGTGSTRIRARDIHEIFNRAVESPSPLAGHLAVLLSSLTREDGTALVRLDE